METIWLDAVAFRSHGGWKTETQFVREMGQAYLIACDRPGVPVADAEEAFFAQKGGNYRFWVRTKNWKLPEGPGAFALAVDGKEVGNICGQKPNTGWYWELAGNVTLSSGKHLLSVRDKTGWLGRFSAVVVTNDLDFVPSPEKERLLEQRAELLGEKREIVRSEGWDFVVVGAGPGGIPAAISAARAGLRVALIEANSVIGGNASDEGTIGLDGAGAQNPGWNETGISDEVRQIRKKEHLTWQGALERVLYAEPNITVFTNTLCIDAKTEGDRICSILCVNTITQRRTEFCGTLFADCSGDGWLGYYAGAKYRIGREAATETGEASAPEVADTDTMSGCACGKIAEGGIKRAYYAVDAGHPVPFELPSWAIRLPEGEALCRRANELQRAEWWLENSNDYDDLFDAEYTRDTLVRLALGYFDWMKHSGNQREKMQNYELRELALYNAKRENRRLIGDYVLTEEDCVTGKSFPDAVSYTGWPIDLHHIRGIYSGAEGAFYRNLHIRIAQIPYRCLYSVNRSNLFFASRCASFTHVALGTTRVESTLATLGQVIGTAAAFCKAYGIAPREVGKYHLEELQQRLLRDDLTIPGIRNTDSKDLARTATVTATSVAAAEPMESVLDPFIRSHLPEGRNGSGGTFRDGFADAEETIQTDRDGRILSPCQPEAVIDGVLRGTLTESHGWYTEAKLPQSLTLTLKKTSVICEIQVTTDTDLTYPRHSYGEQRKYAKTAEHVIVEALSADGWKKVGEKTDNCCRQMRFSFPPISAEAVRVTVLSSAGENVAKLLEIRIYA